MKWTKASEGAPDHMVQVALRNEHGYFGGYYDYSRKVFMVANMGPQGVKPENIEWLDESTPAQTEVVQEASKAWAEQGDSWTGEDLQDQVKAHIASYKHFNWDEALTDHEMYFLIDLLLTFHPSLPPGSIGRPSTVPSEVCYRNPTTLYTYYQLELKNINEEWDTTVSETLEQVYQQLQYLDIHLDDDTELPDGEKRSVIVTGIPLTPLQYKEILEESRKDN